MPSIREMLYAGDSSECAIWEAVLRNLVVEGHQPQYVDPALVDGWSIASLELDEEMPLLDLRSPHFRRLSTNASRHSEWQRLSVVPERDYDETHAAAKELLTAAPKAAGLCWHSRQLGAACAYVFYTPPLKSGSFKLIQTVPLNQPAGWRLVQKALRVAGVEAIGGIDLAAELIGELPPEEANDS